MPNALLIGNSDGIGLALTRALLDRDWTVTGLSRSPSPVSAERYHHHVVDVRSPGYAATLRQAADELDGLDACVYCAGVGEALDLTDLSGEAAVFEVNLLGLIVTVEVVLPGMLAAERGHLIGLSSQADHFINPGAPSYSASKAGMSRYLESLALAVRPHGVHISNVRFGFVATKMAKSEVRPFEISAEQAARRLLRCLDRRPVRYTFPRRMAALLWLIGWVGRARVWFG